MKCSTRYCSGRASAVLASTAIASLMPGACGRTPLLDDSQNPPVDAANGTGTAKIGVPMLKFLAGGLGGYGNQDGTGSVARFSGPVGVASDGAGNLFVADTANHTIRKVVIATGAVATLAGSAGQWGSTDGAGHDALFSSPSGVASDGAGNLFIADSSNSTIRKVVIATGAVTTLAGSAGRSGSTDGTGSAARFFYPYGVASDGAGNLFVADSDSNTIRKIVVASGAVTTLAGSALDSGTSDGTGTAARFFRPEGMASDRAGNLFVADRNHHTIRRVVIATGAVTTLAGSAGNSGSADGVGAAARFNYPSGLASDGEGNLFVADEYNETIRKVVIATGAVTTLAGSADNPGSADGTGAAARFNSPSGLASDGEGNLFVVESQNNTIRKVAIATGAVTTLAGSASNPGRTDGTGTGARFDSPEGVASDGAGNLFVTDSNSSTIRKVVISTGAVTTFVGSPENLGSADGTGSAAQFYLPRGVASDGAGNLFVADAYNHTIRKVVIATRAVTTLAGFAGYQGNTDGSGAAARFNGPSGVASDGAGSLFVADTDNHSIRKVVIATGAVTTLAGSGDPGTTDGTGTAAGFTSPMGVASDGAGNLLVADLGNDTIRRVVIATGTVTTLAGFARHEGSTDGTGTAALFCWPEGLASDGAGNLFVADTYNHTIRKVVIATGAVTTVVGSSGHAGVTPGPLPAGLNLPHGLALGPQGELYITDENAVLVAQF